MEDDEGAAPEEGPHAEGEDQEAAAAEGDAGVGEDTAVETDEAEAAAAPEASEEGASQEGEAGAEEAEKGETGEAHQEAAEAEAQPEVECAAVLDPHFPAIEMGNSFSAKAAHFCVHLLRARAEFLLAAGRRSVC